MVIAKIIQNLANNILFGKEAHMVILNDLQLAINTLHKKSGIYSDRPVLPFGGIMCVRSLAA